MSEPIPWCQQSDQLLKYLYQDLQIFNWTLISTQLSQRLHLQANPDDCRNRYLYKYGPVIRKQWTPSQQKQLYRLHNQNGNKWSIVSQNLLGRTDNSVKNHFYSKLRKSLRTINKIARLHLKKQLKQISDVVIYKLTQATDQSIKSNSQLPPQTITMCYQLKNKLLQYQMDQKDIKSTLDYHSEKQLLLGLIHFNKIYKKKSKKQKISLLGTENLKKNKKYQKKNLLFSHHTQSIQYDNLSDNDQSDKQQSTPKSNHKYSTNNHNHNHKNKLTINKQPTMAQNNNIQHHYSPLPCSQSQSAYKKTINYFIKAPSHQQRDNCQKKSIDLISNFSKTRQKIQTSQNLQDFSVNPQPQQPKNKPKIQDILKAQGILQNGLYGTQNYFRRQNSMRSFSVCSQSSNPDMFGQDLVFGSHFKQLSSMENDSHFFKNNQTQ